MKLKRLFYSCLYLFLIFINSLESNETEKVRLPQSINSFQPAIVPVLTIDGNRLYFDRKFHPNNVGGIRDRDDIWFSNRTVNNTWTESQNLGEPINTPFSDVLFTITPDGSTALVYGIYDLMQKLPGFSIVHINGDHWGIPEALPIRNYYNDSSNYYGFLSYNKQVLILAISQKDSYGDLDLYVSFFDKVGRTWTQPQNLGATINSGGIEGSPFLAYDLKTLYWVSNGREVSENFDTYFARRLDDTWTNWSEPERLNEPINSEFNEKGIWITALADSILFVSSDTSHKRQGIYYSKLDSRQKPLPYFLAEYQLYESDNQDKSMVNKQLEFVLLNVDYGNEISYYSDPNKSSITLILQQDSKYVLKLNNQDYKDYAICIITEQINKPTRIYNELFLTPKSKVSGLVATIYFELDSYQLDKSAITLINELIAKFPDSEFLLVGHTDISGTDDYNMSLSIKRASAVAKQFIVSGKSQKQIQIQGMGKSQATSPIHSEERRVDIIIK